MLVSELVNYASGIPLALCVLGSSLQHQYINHEKPYLKRLRQHPLVKIQDAFKRSFDVLDDNEKNTFLDLACFFRGEDKDHVVNILDGCGFTTELGIYGLIDESLISLVDNKIEMPNIFQDTGRFVVCQESNETGKRSRLWDPTDIVDVLTNNTGTEAIEGIFLDESGLTVELSPTAFEKMYRLRLLKLYCSTSKNNCNVCLPQGLYSLPDELRLLHWERYPLGCLPRNFNPKNIVELNMPYSNMIKLWKGTKNLENLKRIILSHSRQLIKFPRLSKARNLEHIDLEGCTSLVKVNSSFLHHHKLTFLSLKDCSHLRIMPTTVHLEALEVLNLSGCSELEDFPDFSPNLKKLHLAGTAVTEMPASIGGLTRLVTLDLENCNRLQHLPPEIRNLKVVVTLSAKRPASSMDLSSVGETAPPYKRWRLKTVIESVILSFRKRKRGNSVSMVNEETGEEKEVRENLVDGDNLCLESSPQSLSQSLITHDLRSPYENSGQPLSQANSSAYSTVDEPARTLKGPRFVWTPQLHKRFVSAVAQLEIKNANPKSITQFMSVDGLTITRENVASHLQKYRLYLGRLRSGGGRGIVIGESDHLFASSHVPRQFLFPITTTLQHHHQQPPQFLHPQISGVNFTSQEDNDRKAMEQDQSLFLAIKSQQQQQQQQPVLTRPASLHLHSQVANYAEDLERHHLNKVGFSTSIVDTSSDLVEASTVSGITHTNVGGDTCDSLHDEEDSQFWLHL